MPTINESQSTHSQIHSPSELFVHPLVQKMAALPHSHTKSDSNMDSKFDLLVYLWFLENGQRFHLYPPNSPSNMDSQSDRLALLLIFGKWVALPHLPTEFTLNMDSQLDRLALL